MLLYAAIIMALGLMAFGYIFKRPAAAFGAAGAWVVAAVAAYTASAAAWDMYYGMFWFCIVLVIVSAFEVFYSKEKKKEPEVNPKDDWDDYADDMKTRRERIDKMRSLSRRRRSD